MEELNQSDNEMEPVVDELQETLSLTDDTGLPSSGYVPFRHDYENGYSSELFAQSSDSEPDVEPPEVGTTGTVRTFDMNLPTEHSYLGPDLESRRGRTVFEDHQIVKMHVLPSNTIVCPGYTLPLTYDADSPVIRNIMAQDGTFGLFFALDGNRTSYSQLGVTMEIYEYAETRFGIGLKAKGRQRFRVLNKDDNSQTLYRVRILPDIQLPPILQSIQITALNRHRVFVTDILSFKQNELFRKWDANQTRLPIWIYDEFDEQLCVQKLRILLKNFAEFLPSDPMQLSYWGIQNVLLSRKERLDILSHNCSVQRLRALLEQIQTPRYICCGRCRRTLATQEDLFPMSKDGLQNNFVNPSGVVHETLTVLNANHISLVGGQSKDFSWFPGHIPILYPSERSDSLTAATLLAIIILPTWIPASLTSFIGQAFMLLYAWIIANCEKCHSHVGWLFKADRPELRPKKFYGLTRSSVVVVAHKGYKTRPKE